MGGGAHRILRKRTTTPSIPSPTTHHPHTQQKADDGTLWSWGINGHGQLGHSADLKHCAEPTEVILPDTIADVAAGEAHTLALSSSGEVWAAGCNANAQLGLGSSASSSNAAASTSGSGSGGSGGGARSVEFRLVRGALRGRAVSAVAAGQEHSLALDADGRVYSWGRGNYGQLGLGPRETAWASEPRRVEALEGVRVKAIAAGAFHSAAVDADGGVWAWGRGESWQLGTGLAAHECEPRRVEGLRHASRVALGTAHSLAAGSHGPACTWGSDDGGGCLGQGFPWPPIASRAPQRIGVRLRRVAAGWRHCAGADDDGRLYTWGWGGAVGAGGMVSRHADLGAGQLGHGDDCDVHEPKQVMRLTLSPATFRDLRQRHHQGAGAGADGGLWRAREVSCGRNHTAAVVEVAATAGEVL